jgi:magnesium transporter
MISTLVYRDARLAGENPPFEQLAVLRADPAVMLWVDLSESPEDEARRILADVFAVHPLTIEDCLQDSPLPKVEQYDEYLYLVLHAVDYTRAEKFTTTEVDFILGKNFLVTYHRKPLKPVQVARDRALRNTHALIRGPDRLAHNVLDLLVDYYGPALAELRTEVEAVEGAVLGRSAGKLEAQIIELRSDLTELRQIIRPQRELAAELAQGKTGFFRPKLVPYLRDLHDELARIEELAVSWNDQLRLIFRVYLNRASHEANEGIRVLTALTAITLPTVIVGGWFGQNFISLPWTESLPAYWITFGLTAAVTAWLFFFLRKRRWF